MKVHNCNSIKRTKAKQFIEIYEVVINVLCRPKVKYAVSLIVTVLTGRGPRSPGSIEFLFLIWTGYFNLGSS